MECSRLHPYHNRSLLGYERSVHRVPELTFHQPVSDLEVRMFRLDNDGARGMPLRIVSIRTSRGSHMHHQQLGVIIVSLSTYDKEIGRGMTAVADNAAGSPPLADAGSVVWLLACFRVCLSGSGCAGEQLILKGTRDLRSPRRGGRFS